MFEAGDFAAELKIRKALVRSYPKEAVHRAALGNALWETGNLQHAEKEFREATILRPSTRAFSLCLFHVLWEQDLQQEAAEEADRFLSLSHTEKYLHSREYEEYSALIKKIKAQRGEDKI